MCDIVTRKKYNIYSVIFAITSSHLDLTTVHCFKSSVIHVMYSAFVRDQQLYLLVQSVLRPSATQNTKYRILRQHPLTPCCLQCAPLMTFFKSAPSYYLFTVFCQHFFITFLTLSTSSARIILPFTSYLIYICMLVILVQPVISLNAVSSFVGNPFLFTNSFLQLCFLKLSCLSVTNQFLVYMHQHNCRGYAVLLNGVRICSRRETTSTAARGSEQAEQRWQIYELRVAYRQCLLIEKPEYSE